MLRHARFDMNDCFGGPYPGYTDDVPLHGEVGWHAPLFPKASADAILARWNDYEGLFGWYDADTDTYEFHCDGETPDSAWPLCFSSEVHVIAGVSTRLYAIGCGLWIWDEVKAT